MTLYADPHLQTIARPDPPPKNRYKVVLAVGTAYVLSRPAVSLLRRAASKGEAWEVFDNYADHVRTDDRLCVWLAVFHPENLTRCR